MVPVFFLFLAMRGVLVRVFGCDQCAGVVMQSICAKACKTTASTQT